MELKKLNSFNYSGKNLQEWANEIREKRPREIRSGTYLMSLISPDENGYPGNYLLKSEFGEDKRRFLSGEEIFPVLVPLRNCTNFNLYSALEATIETVTEELGLRLPPMETAFALWDRLTRKDYSTLIMSPEMNGFVQYSGESSNARFCFSGKPYGLTVVDLNKVTPFTKYLLFCK